MDGLNSLSTFGAHPKEFDPEQVRPVLINLAAIIKWYLKYKTPEAYRYFIQGFSFFGEINYYPAIELFNKALEIDSNFFAARMWLTWAYHNLGIYEKSRVYLQELLEQIENYSYPEQLMLKTLKSEYDKDPSAGIKYSEMLLEYDPNPAWYWQLGLYYSWIRQDEKAVQFLEKALDVLQQWNVLSNWPYLYTLPGHIYHEHYLLLREIEKTINNQNK